MHCISVYLIRKSDLRDEKIDSIIGGKSLVENWNGENNSGVIFTELKSGIFATTEIPDIREFGKNKMVAYITTDYFGGFGDQTAQVFDCGKKIYDYSVPGSMNTSDSIDEALKLMGVVCVDGYDEFDTIGLGKYRSNEDFNQ